jgi:hypothetical protein
MTTRNNKAELVGFLEEHAFQPVLRAKGGSVPLVKRDELAGLQRRTRAAIERFRSYRPASEVVANFRRDLHSGKAQEFEALAERLSVGSDHR